VELLCHNYEEIKFEESNHNDNSVPFTEKCISTINLKPVYDEDALEDDEQQLRRDNESCT
jgi:hypothetical protein